MNRTLKLSMVMALALGSSQVLALDLGQVQIKSALGQPLLAEIPLHSATPAELHSLSVQLASSEQFAKAGIVGGRTSIPLHFSVSNAGGHAVIRITSSAPVDDPYLDLLLQVNSSAGKSVREFAILLDPPGAAAQPSESTTPAPRRTSPVAARASAVPSRASRASSAPAVANGKYGPVSRGQTLSSIAHNTAPSGVNVQQMMLALKQANPDAFYRDNINALKSGEVLRVPTAAEAQAMSIAAAIAEVRRQNSDWRAGTPGKPTVVANAATRETGTATPTAASSNSDRLSLVPAKEGAGTQAGSSAGSGKNDTALRQDLLRAQEGLASAQQQSADLKTRLKDLTDINSKNEHLLSLKDNQIAELQAKLASARKAAGQPAAAASIAKTPAESTPTETTAMAPATLPETSKISPASSTVAPAVAGTAAINHATSATSASSMAASSATAAPATSGSSMASAASTAPATIAPVSKPVKLAAAPVHAPAPASPPPVVEQPWYMQTWAWAAAGGVVVLLLLLAMMGRRKAAPAATAKSASSLADRFGAPNADPNLISGDDVDQEELLDQLAEHPDDIGLHLELVTLYYSRRDVDHFEAAAEAMHAHITDPQQDEWQDVLHMGEDLAPEHPLFDHHVEPVQGEGEAHQAFDIDDYAGKNEAPTVVSTMPPALPAAPRKVSEYSFNFDLTSAPGDHANSRNTAPAPAPADDATVLAPLVNQRAPDANEAAPAEPASSWQFDDLEPVGSAHVDDASGFNDDPVDTKLDLARAYLDMGDADGARAMLGEVIKEGSQTQRDTAKRLLDGLH